MRWLSAIKVSTYVCLLTNFLIHSLLVIAVEAASDVPLPAGLCSAEERVVAKWWVRGRRLRSGCWMLSRPIHCPRLWGLAWWLLLRYATSCYTIVQFDLHSKQASQCSDSCSYSLCLVPWSIWCTVANFAVAVQMHAHIWCSADHSFMQGTLSHHIIQPSMLNHIYKHSLLEPITIPSTFSISANLSAPDISLFAQHAQVCSQHRLSLCRA